MKLILFHSHTCKQCRNQVKEFTDNPPSIQLEMVDIDAGVKDNDSSAFERIYISMRNYGITDLPTTVLINDDNDLIRKFIDFVETKEIEENLLML